MVETTTSGTTGPRKTVELTPEQFEAKVKRLALTRGPEFTKLKSFYFGFADHTNTLRQYESYAKRAGVTIYKSQGDFDKTIVMINRDKPEGILAPPSVLLKIALAEDRTHKPIYLRSSHGVLPQNVARTVKRMLLAPGGVAYVGYGMSERGGSFLGTFDDAIEYPGCVGKAVEGVEYALDPDGQIRFKVKSEHGNVSEYKGNKAASVKNFKTIDGAVWFYPGDKARLLPNGKLALLGRAA